MTPGSKMVGQMTSFDAISLHYIYKWYRLVSSSGLSNESEFIALYLKRTKPRW